VIRDTGSSGGRSETSGQTNLTTLPLTWSTGAAWSSSPVSAYGSSAAASQPVLSVAPSSLIFTAMQGGSDPPPAYLTISNTGIGTLSFTANSDSSWLSISPSSGTAPVTAQVSATVGSLTAGSHCRRRARLARNGPGILHCEFASAATCGQRLAYLGARSAAQRQCGR
jgi:Viral BACON domain